MNAVYLVETSGGRLTLRGHRKPDREAVEFEHDVMDAVRAAGIPAPAALTTRNGDRTVGQNGRWWSLLVWIEGDQPQRGHHTVEQALSMGEMLGRIHVALTPVPPMSTEAPIVETTVETVARADELLALIEGRPESGDDEASAIRWLRAQRDWLQSHLDDTPPTGGPVQTIHGDYHDANLVFQGGTVVGVLDWDKAIGARPLEEVVRAMHLSRLNPEQCEAFLRGYGSERHFTAPELDAAAARYGFQRDRSLWLFDELYRQGNERLRQLLNPNPFVPFEAIWMTSLPRT
jgi:Ser/Thr protein kinase RdoA (MazF antagonist)